MTNYYRLLGLRKDASDAEIRAAYKKLALANNPKRQRPRPMLTPSEHAQEQLMREQAEQLESLQIFMLTAEAYDVLSDPLKKEIYDKFGEQALKEGFDGPEGRIPGYTFHGDPYATFREFFGTENPFAALLAGACAPKDANKDASSLRPKDPPIQKPLSLTLEEIYTGAIKKLIISKKILKDDGITTEMRDKVLTVKIPPGANEGMKFVFPGEGDQTPKMKPADIIFVVEIQKHPTFVRVKDNLIMTYSLTLGDALCGALVKVNTLDGRTFSVYNVHMVQPGYEKVLPGEGMPVFGEPGKKGDLIIRFKVKYPNKLSEAQKKHLKAALTSSKGGPSSYEKSAPATFTIKEDCVCPEQT